MPATVNQIGDGTWALFPHQVFLKPNQTYVVRMRRGVRGLAGGCSRTPAEWRFTTAETGQERGDTRIPEGYLRVNSTAGITAAHR